MCVVFRMHAQHMGLGHTRTFGHRLCSARHLLKCAHFQLERSVFRVNHSSEYILEGLNDINFVHSHTRNAIWERVVSMCDCQICVCLFARYITFRRGLYRCRPSDDVMLNFTNAARTPHMLGHCVHALGGAPVYAEWSRIIEL